MANASLTGITTQYDIKPDDFRAVNDIQSSSTNYASARAGATSGPSAATFISASNTLQTSAILDTGTYRVARPVILFQIPDNITRIESSQLLLYPHSSPFTASIKPVTNNVNVSSNKTYLYGDEGVEGASLFRGVQAVASAALTSETPSFILNRYNTINLNMLATYYITQLKGNFIISLVNNQYDFGSTPSTPSTNNDAHNTSDFRPPGHANGPVLVLKKPWFINDQGNEYSTGEDFVIRASTVGVNQKDRAVDQLPFATAIPGPAFMRQRNSIYQVTKG